ncbi:MAG: phosphatase PAP2 family protein [Candidatus Omnitrophica bacterium]|nr:phosphatase PAP2 family protein [Candidatus Omnitrophota bacterium]
MKREIVAWFSIFALFTTLTVKGIFKGIDRIIADVIIIYANPVLDRIFSVIRSLGHPGLCFLIASIISTYAFLKRAKKFAIFSFIIFILLVNTGYGLKNIIKRERPSDFYYRENPWYLRFPENIIPGPLHMKFAEKEKVYIKKSYSYPSGHSLRTFFLFFVLAMLVDKTKLSKREKDILRGIFYGLIISIGFSSIYLGAHWLSDIIGAYILAYVFYLILSYSATYEKIS